MNLSYELAATTLEKIQNKNAERISNNDVKDYLTALICDLKTVALTQRDVETKFDALKQTDQDLCEQINEETSSMGINWTLVSPFQHAPKESDLKQICTKILDLYSQAVEGNADHPQGKSKKPKKPSSKKKIKDMESELAKMTKAILSALKILHDTKGINEVLYSEAVGRTDMGSTVPLRTGNDMATELIKEVTAISSAFKKMQDTKGELENASRRLDQMAKRARMQDENYNAVEGAALKTNTIVPSQGIFCLHTILDEIEEFIMKQSMEIQMKKSKVNEVGPELQKSGLSHEDALRKIDLLQTRLSAFASASLTNNNPIFADLSDPNRPTNLQEQFRNLYTKERLAAFDKLCNPCQKESDVAKTLLTIFKDVFDFCRSKRKIQRKVLHGIIFHPNRDVASYQDQNVNIPKNEVFEKHLSDAVKFSSEMAAENVAGAYFETKANETDDGNQIRMIETYVKQCAKLCWLTQVQTPPVYIDLSARHGDQFNKAIYTEYKHTGKYIDFVVWPPILLHKNGPLLAMGVAEGM